MFGALLGAGMNMFGGSAGSGLIQGTPLSEGGSGATAAEPSITQTVDVDVGVDAKLFGGAMTSSFGGGSSNTILIIAGILAVVLIMGKK